MNTEHLPPALPAGPSTWMTVCGVAFMVIWFMGSVVWAAMSLMGSLMANDSGSASTEKHTTLIVGMLVGQIIAALAAIPGGLAFFWPDHRWQCIWIFVGAVVVGAGIQVWAFMSFFSGTH